MHAGVAGFQIINFNLIIILVNIKEEKMKTLVAAAHVAKKGNKPDRIFAIARAASEAIAQVGKDRVVNATLGVIYNEQENFASFQSVENHLKQMAPEEIMNYAPIGGLPEFLDAAIEMTFQGNMPENTYAKSVATPGGTGALRHVIYNYLEPGQKVLVPDYFWGSYQTIAQEHHRGIDTYRLFDKNNSFNISSITEKVEELLKEQDNLVIIFNTPAHNPTGYSMTDADWHQVLDLMKACARNKEKRIIILLDIAYIDFAGKPKEVRSFLRLFGGLPENILVTIAFSMSKSFLMYGMRSGALIGLSSSPEVIDEFFEVNSLSNRGVWSNGTRSAQRLLVDVVKNPELKSKIETEQTAIRELMNKRVDIFMQEAQRVGLETCPYQSGFFITIPAQDPVESARKLAQDNIFVVDMCTGMRVAICGIPTHKIPGLAAKIKKAL
jgi:aromatic-amino-acid transaminase